MSLSEELSIYCEIMRYAHKGQLDKSGEVYWHHPERVASKFRLCSYEQFTGLLHDVVEDSNISLDDLRELGVTEVVIEAVRCITHEKHENYLEYLKRVKSNPIALAVKLKDIEDNLNPHRLHKLPQETVERLKKKYETALDYLTTSCD